MAHSGFKPEDLYQPVSEETSNQTAQDSGTTADSRVPGSNKERIWGKQNLTYKANFNLLMSLKSHYVVTTQLNCVVEVVLVRWCLNIQICFYKEMRTIQRTTMCLSCLYS